MSRAEFAVLGAGAIGTIIAAHLARAGHSVALLARGQRARQIQNEGLRVKGLVEFSTGIQVLTDPSVLRAADVLIVCTKTPGTQAALHKLQHVELGTTFSIQNGVVKDEWLAQAYGRDRVLGALADTSGELLPSGEVNFTRNANLFIGELTHQVSERATRLAGIINDAGIRATAVSDILSREWSKFAGWLGLACLSVTTRAVTWRYLDDPDCALVLMRLIREMALLARAQGIPLTSSLLPLDAIVEGRDSEAIESIRRIGADFRSGAPAHRTSVLQDLEAGRPLEIEETFGYAVCKAKELKLSLPLLECMYHLVAAIDHMRA